MDRTGSGIAGAEPNIMKLGIEIARVPREYVLDVKGVITWKYLRVVVWSYREMRLCRVRTHYAHTHTNSCANMYSLVHHLYLNQEVIAR